MELFTYLYVLDNKVTKFEKRFKNGACGTHSVNTNYTNKHSRNNKNVQIM